MQVQSINNYAQNFKGIYFSNIDGRFSESQLNVVNDIKSSLRTVDANDFKGRTYEQRFKEDKGVDFIIEPSGNAVTLSAVQDFTKHDRGYYTYNVSKAYQIGRYDESASFNVEDLEPHKKSKTFGNIAVIAVFLGLPIIAAVSYITNKSAPAKKAVIEKIDSLKSMQNDSSKTLNLIVK